jgi:hypothetical protein
MPHLEISLFELHIVEGMHMLRNLTYDILLLVVSSLDYRLLLLSHHPPKERRAHLSLDVILAQLLGKIDQKVRVKLRLFHVQL